MTMRIFQKLCSVLLLILPLAPLHAQKQRVNYYDEIDECDLLVTYDFVRLDTVLNKSISYDMALQIGPIYRKFYVLQQYDYDKTVWEHGNLMERSEAQALYHSSNIVYFTFLWHHVPKNKFTEYGLIYTMYYLNEDSLAVQDWTISEADTMTVCGYICKKATCKFRGREWTAWYAEELNMDAGPWKLHGLPGLILKATDSHAVVQFEATSVQPDSYPIEKHTQLMKSTRFINHAKYLELERMLAFEGQKLDIMLNGAAPPGFENIPDIRRFYCPLELE